MKAITYKNITIDFLSQKITIDEAPIKLDPKAFKTLKYLVHKRHRVVTNDELIEKVWDDRQITNDVVISAIGRIRKLFKDANVTDESIHTVHKVGYQFTLDIKIIETQITSIKTSKNNSFHQKLNWAITILLLITSAFLFKNYFYNNGITPTFEQQPRTEIKNIQSATTEIFFLRHAEKNLNEGNNPHLSDVGIKRAEYWYKFFNNIQFDEVYTTDFHRNMETAALVNQEKNEIKIYSALSFDILQHLSVIKGKKVLIIGHSNTIPDMVNRIIGDSQYKPMSHKNYNLIYHVIIDSSGTISSNLYHLELSSSIATTAKK